MSKETTASAPAPREPAFDGLRGVAVMLVFLFHYGGGLTSHNRLLHAFGELAAAGWIGVQIFFVLSGFLITGILWRNQNHKQPLTLRNFYMRRALRIVPLTWIVITVSLLFCMAMGNAGKPLFYEFVPEYLYLQDMPRIMHGAESVQKLPLFHLWSIAVEEQFYLFWPLVLLAVRRSLRAAKVLCGIILAGSLIYNAFYALHPGLIAEEVQQRSFFTYCGALALGSLLALLFSATAPAPSLRRIRLSASTVIILGLGGFFVAGILHRSFLLTGKQYLFALPCVWLFSAGLLVQLLLPGRVQTFFSNAFLRFVGRFSFGVYVLHIFLEPLYDHIGFAIAHQFYGYLYLATRLVAGFPITLLLAWISYQIVEFPFLKLKRYFPSAPAPVEGS